MFSVFVNPFVDDSYSRQLDKRVQSQEMPYGYNSLYLPENVEDRDEDEKIPLKPRKYKEKK